MKNNKKYVYSFIALAVFLTLATAVPVLADNGQSDNGVGGGFGGGMIYNRGKVRGMMGKGVYGTVSAINGNIITVTMTSRQKGSNTTAVTTSYTVDATNAKITKNNVAGTISSILVGDTIMAQGTLTGTNLVATNVRDGQTGKGMRGDFNGPKNNQLNVPPIAGNGQPIVIGTVSSVNGSTMVITNKSNVTYTIDATNAKIMKGPNTALVSSIAVGDMVIVQGAVSGTNVTASTIIDQAKPPVNTNDNEGGNNQGGESHGGGFFGGMGSFFAHLFGF